MYTLGYLKNAFLVKIDMPVNQVVETGLMNKFVFYANESMTQICSAIKPNIKFQNFVIFEQDVNQTFKMPSDFISFGNHINYRLNSNQWSHLETDAFKVVGYNKLLFTQVGSYMIQYNARWITFTQEMSDTVELDVPADILDAIPSYVASQCLKIDDEQKAGILRNEYEAHLARINAIRSIESDELIVRGGW